MNRQEIDKFEKIQAQLNGLHMEISNLSKKSQNDALNKFKIKFVNQLVSAANEILNEDKPFNDFTSFDEDDIPTNSDVVMMLTQYLNCFEKLRTNNIIKENFNPVWYWVVDGKISDIRTAIPEKIK